MFLNAALPEHLGLVDAGVIALLGYAVVFFGLVLLMIVITLLGKAFTKASAAPKAAPAPAAAAAPVPEAPKPVAPGAAGQLMLHDVEPKTAAH